jgi:hypothetical protein
MQDAKLSRSDEEKRAYYRTYYLANQEAAKKEEPRTQSGQ